MKVPPWRSVSMAEINSPSASSLSRIALGAGRQGVVKVFPLLVHGQDQDLDSGVKAFYLPGGFQTPEVRHGDIHNHQVGVNIPQEPQEFESITGFSHHFHAVHPLNHTPDTPAKHHMIISQTKS